MASTLELVGKLKAQLAESRQDLLKDQPKAQPKDGGALAGSVSSQSSRAPEDGAKEEIASLREEVRRHSNELTSKLTSLAFSTRQLSQQLVREREDRLAFQQEVRENRIQLPGAGLLESTMVTLRQDLETLSGQFQVLQEELEGSLQSLSLQMNSVVNWVQEKLDIPPPFTKDGICLSPILEDREAGSAEKAEELPMSQVIRNIATEMPPIVEQMAEKSQLLLARVEQEREDRMASEAYLKESLQSLSHRVEEVFRKRQEDLLLRPDERLPSAEIFEGRRPETALPMPVAWRKVQDSQPWRLSFDHWRPEPSTMGRH